MRAFLAIFRSFFRSGIRLYAAATERTSSTVSSVQTGAALKELPDFKLCRSRNFFYCVEVLVVSESPLTAAKFWANKLPRIYIYIYIALLSLDRHKFARALAIILLSD